MNVSVTKLSVNGPMLSNVMVDICIVTGSLLVLDQVVVTSVSNTLDFGCIILDNLCFIWSAELVST